jgi:hypothetical protein
VRLPGDDVRGAPRRFIRTNDPIIGGRKLAQFQENLASFDLRLSADQLKTLDEASRIELGFPHDMYAKAMPRAVSYGGMRDEILA